MNSRTRTGSLNVNGSNLSNSSPLRNSVDGRVASPLLGSSPIKSSSLSSVYSQSSSSPVHSPISNISSHVHSTSTQSPPSLVNKSSSLPNSNSPMKIGSPVSPLPFYGIKVPLNISAIHHQISVQDSNSNYDLKEKGRGHEIVSEATPAQYVSALKSMENNVLNEVHLRHKAEKEQSRLLERVHELENQVENLNREYRETIERTTAASQASIDQAINTNKDLQTKLKALEEMRSVTLVQLAKYKTQAEGVLRGVEVRLAEEGDARKKAEVLLERAVLTARHKMQQKQSQIDTLTQKLKDEEDNLSKMQGQLEKQLQEKENQHSLTKTHLKESKQREIELTSQLVEANQLNNELNKKLQQIESNSMSLKNMLASMNLNVQPIGNFSSTGNSPEVEAIRVAFKAKEQEYTTRLNEQNQLIRILRQTLAHQGTSTPVNKTNEHSLKLHTNNTGDTFLETDEIRSMKATITELTKQNEELLRQAEERNKTNRKRVNSMNDEDDERNKTHVSPSQSRVHASLLQAKVIQYEDKLARYEAETVQLRELVKKMERAMKGREDQLSSSTSVMEDDRRSLENMLTERDKTINRMKQDIEERDLTIRKIEREESERAEHINRLTREMSERDETIRRLAQQLKEMGTVDKEEELILSMRGELEQAGRLRMELERRCEILQAEKDESLQNELRLLEQVEQYEWSSKESRQRIQDLETYIIENDGLDKVPRISTNSRWGSSSIT